MKQPPNYFHPGWTGQTPCSGSAVRPPRRLGSSAGQPSRYKLVPRTPPSTSPSTTARLLFVDPGILRCNAVLNPFQDFKMRKKLHDTIHKTIISFPGGSAINRTKSQGMFCGLAATQCKLHSRSPPSRLAPISPYCAMKSCATSPGQIVRPPFVSTPI